MTQAQFAKKLNTSQSAINRIEKGKQNISLSTLARISEVLNKPIVKLGSEAISLEVNGGFELSGEIEVKTSKNSCVGLICASLLNQGTTRLRKVAKIEEVNRLIEVMQSMGVKVSWTKDGDLTIKPPRKLNLSKLNIGSAAKTRSAFMFLAALSTQYKSFNFPHAGGCELGKRTVLPHIFLLQEFGINVVSRKNDYSVSVKRETPKRDVVLYESGDTVTEHALMIAALEPGWTRIKLASANYAIQDVCLFLQKLGAKIEGIGSTTLKIRGFQKQPKKNVTYSPSEDPVEAMTFISAAVTTNSSITIKRAPIEFLELELLKLEKMGLKFLISSEYTADNGFTRLVDITIQKHNGTLKAAEEKIYGRPFPGLNIDNLPYFIPIAAVAKAKP